ncbi:MAG: decaprenyl-phosphate phosphoribosyltransferase [Solirubrobacteraceae bacterium]
MQPVDPGPASARRVRDQPLPATAAAVARTTVPRPVTPIRLPQRGRRQALLALARPRQWVKNALVVGAPGAAGALGQDDVPVRVLVTCAAFCLLSAGIYALNDVRDRHEDRRHPRKARRPVAAGEISPRDAAVSGAVWIVSGLILGAAVTPMVAVVGLAYVALTVTYSWIWRRLPLLDLIALAGGFVLRAVAGGVAAPVGLSRWFVLVVTCVAVFVAAGKRLAELIRAPERRAGGRQVLRFYTHDLLSRVLALAGAGALFAYCVWAFELPDIDGIPWRPLTVIPFAVCLLRYGSLVRAGAGEAPEEILTADRTLAIAAVSWLLLFVMSVNAAG